MFGCAAAATEKYHRLQRSNAGGGVSSIKSSCTSETTKEKAHFSFH